MSEKLSNTLALSKQSQNNRPRLASDAWDGAPCAEAAVARNSLGQFRRETGAGDSSLAEAVKCAKGKSYDKE